jgi:CheY-like chemotaxis protein
MPHKLLLADDSVTIQRVIELTFADEDIHVRAVGDGQKAIASIQADRPDIVLADVGMPERDGYEVAAFVKGNPELAHIPVLLLTGAFEPIDETRARAVGCDGVLVKPFEPQMVINRVKDLLAGRRPSGLWGASPPAQTPPRPPAVPGAGADVRSAEPQTAPPAPGGSLEDYFDRLDAAFASFDGGAAGASPVAVSPPPPAGPPPGLDPRHAPATAATAESSSAGDDVLAGWDPDLTGDPRKPAPIEPPPIELDPSRGFAPAASPQHSAPSAPAAQGTPSPEVHSTLADPRLQPPSAPQPPPVYAAPAGGAAAAPFAPVAALPTLAEAFATLLSAEQSQAVAPSAIAPASVSDDMVEEIVRRVIARMGDQAVRDTVVDVAERLVRQEIERIRNS